MASVILCSIHRISSANLLKVIIPSLASQALIQNASCISCVAVSRFSNPMFAARRLPPLSPWQPDDSKFRQTSRRLATKSQSNFRGILVYECNFRKFLYYTYMVSAGTLVPILAMAGYRINELLKHMNFGLECFTNLDSPILHMTMISAFGIGLTYGMYSLLGRVLVSIFYDAPPTSASDAPPTSGTSTYSAFRYDGLLRLKRVDFAADNCLNLADASSPANSTARRNNGGGAGLMAGIADSSRDGQEPEIVSLMRGNLQIHNKKYSVFRNDFHSPAHYNILFGYSPIPEHMKSMPK